MLWIKALHIISVICWYAGLFYLPRLFVYHTQAEDTISIERFKIMERRLYYGIMTPAMIATFVFGIWVSAYQWSFIKTQGWFHAKLLCVFLLLGFHKMCKVHMKQFAKDANTKSHVYYRWFNEVPSVFLVIIVILVVVKPF